MITRFTPQLNRNVLLRPDTSDEQTWTDTFQIGYHVPPEMNPRFVLDLGANIGLTAAHYQAMWPQAKILAIEMDAANAQLCRRNFSGLVVNVAVGATAGMSSYTRWGWQASYSLVHPGDTPVRVLTISQLLDDCLPDAENVFCKMDIEGAEWDIFAYGIDERIKWLLAELHNDESPDKMVKRGTKLLMRGGFTVMRHIIHPKALWATR